MATQNNKVVCKYNVTSTTSTTKLIASPTYLPFASMSIDGVEQSEVVLSYKFDTTGEHTVLLTLKEGETSIYDHAFSGCSRLTIVTIGNSVTSIGEEAFDSCSGLTSITIPDSVTSIGNGAFRHCYGLTSVTIGNSVTSIGNGAFENCPILTFISVAANNQIYDSRNNCNAIIETSTNTLIFGCENTIIPNSVTSIGNKAFYYCSRLTNIIIHDSVTSIGTSAFYGCSGLTSITCNAMTAPTIQSDTFYDVKTGGTLTVPAGSTGYDIWMGTGDYYLGKYNWTKIEQ